MKKIVYLFSALIVMFFSCSPIDSAKIKPKTIKYTNTLDPLKNFEAVFTYNGDKILSVISKINKKDYFYNGDFIVKEIEYAIIDGKAQKREEKTISFAHGKEKSIISIQTNSDNRLSREQKEFYTYTNDSTITKEIYDAKSEETLKKSKYIRTLTIKNGNLIREEMVNNNVNTFFVYEYDKKNNPYKNVLGYITPSRGCFVNNLTKITRNSGIEYGDVSIIVCEYNDHEYPTKVSFQTKDNIIVGTMEYTY